MGRPTKITKEALIDACLKFKLDIITEAGKIVGKQHPIWPRIVNELGSEVKPESVYTKVIKNEFDVLDILRGNIDDVKSGK